MAGATVIIPQNSQPLQFPTSPRVVMCSHALPTLLFAYKQ